MTAEQKVKAKYPDAYAAHRGEWLIEVQSEKEIVILGAERFPQAAWEDAARRVEAGQ